MGRLQLIEKALASINEAVFQELCDSFLVLRNNNYSTFSRVGSMSGKQKTIKGTPDTFILLPNGKYIFVEYSTNKTKGIKKLAEDIKKCLDEQKTGISVAQILEIILCVNFELKVSEVEFLKSFLSNTRIGLTIYSLKVLSLELFYNHRDLVHEYLGLPLDTGQIVSIKTFIESYNNAANSIATPLDNPFLYRENELEELKNAISTNDFIIITGAPGVGKTRLSLEAINGFLSQNPSFIAYCIQYKHTTLIDDLYTYFDVNKNYVLFVDDANRIDSFNQITTFYKASRFGKLKVVITVRDYALQHIISQSREYITKRIEVSKLSNKQIDDIISSKPFEILNPTFRSIIKRISEGNPRLAIMAARLAIQHDISSLVDASDLFETYFATFIKDNGDISNKFNIKCLGLISFFFTIPYKDEELTSALLHNFGMNYEAFAEAIDILDNMELVELQYNHVKIPEQNLAIFFFYKTFIKDELLSFETLLNKYYDIQQNRFNDCIIPANNTFGYDNVINKIKPCLRRYWKDINEDEKRSLKFLGTFWFYLPNETFQFVLEAINKKPIPTDPIYDITTENKHKYPFEKNETIELLKEFYRYNNEHLKTAIELSFEYVRRSPELFSDLILNIQEQLVFDVEDEMSGFSRQIVLVELLINGLNAGDKLYTKAFYELGKTFLGFSFRQTRGGEDRTITFYEYKIPDTPIIRELRSRIWGTISNNFTTNFDMSFDVLNNFPDLKVSYLDKFEKAVLQSDMNYVVDMIKVFLTPNSFEHCRYVQEQIRTCKSVSVSNPFFDELSQDFINPTYLFYLKIDWNRYRDKEEYEFDDYKKYEKLKEEEIRKSFVLNSNENIEAFYKNFAFLRNLSHNKHGYNISLDIVVDENIKKHFNIGYQLLEKVISQLNEVEYTPQLLFQNHLQNQQNILSLWSLIKKSDFKRRSAWELSFFAFLPPEFATKEVVEDLILTFKNMSESYFINFNSYLKFLEIDNHLFQNILKAIVDKNEKDNLRLNIWDDLFTKHFELLGDDIELIEKAYIQQVEQQNHFDYKGQAMLNILRRDVHFIYQQIKRMLDKKDYGFPDDHKNRGFVWEINGIESILKDIFYLIIEKEGYHGLQDHFTNSFFRDIPEEHKQKAKQFLFDFAKENFANTKRMNVIVDITRHSMKDVYEDVLLFYLSLTQDPQLFSKIWWRGNGGVYSGDVIIGDIEAAEWRNILSLVEKSNLGLRLIPIKGYINDRIESCLKSGDWERQRRFLERY